MSNSVIGTLTQGIELQPGYPRRKRTGQSMWELVAKYIGRADTIDNFVPAHETEIISGTIKLPDHIKVTYGHLILQDVDIVPLGDDIHEVLTLTFVSPSSSGVGTGAGDEWSSNSVYKEVALGVEDIPDSDVSPSGGESMEEAKQAYLKALKEKGKGTKATAEIQYIHRKKYNSTSLSENDLVNGVGENDRPPGVSGASDDNWINSGRTIQANNDGKVVTNTYQFYNTTV